MQVFRSVATQFPHTLQGDAEALDVVEHGPEVQSKGRGGRSNNARMHPSNKYYQAEPDFVALSRQYPEIRQYITVGSGGG